MEERRRGSERFHLEKCELSFNMKKGLQVGWGEMEKSSKKTILWTKVPEHRMSLCLWRKRRGYPARPLDETEGKERSVPPNPQVFNPKAKWENSLFPKDTTSFSPSFSMYHHPCAGNLEIPSYRFQSPAPNGTYINLPEPKMVVDLNGVYS